MGNIAHQNMSMTWGQVCSAQNKVRTVERMTGEIDTQIRNHKEKGATETDIFLTGRDAFDLFALAGERPPSHVRPNDEIYLLPEITVQNLKNKLKTKLHQFRQRGLHIV